MKLLFILPLLSLTLLYIPNSGGADIALPFNLAFILYIGLAVTLLAFRDVKVSAQTECQPLLSIGVLMLLLPWLMQSRSNPGILVLLAAILLGFGLLRLPLTPRHKRTVLLSVFLLALVQAGVSLLQAFCPHLAARLYEFDWLRNKGRPYGIFQQVNLLASFLASGLGCGYLWLLTARRAKPLGLMMIGLGLLAFVLALNQSRAGAIGAVLATTSIAVAVGRKNMRRSGAALVMMALCACVGVYITQHVAVLVNGEPYLMARDYTASTHERWQILYVTWQMIMLHPWAGWGYGTFEFAFSRYVLAHPELGYTYSTIVTHPHNELLYAWYQGGVVSFIGMLTLLAGWVNILLKTWRHRLRSTGYALLIIPLLVHLNLEYPFYQSFIHFGLFVLLLRLGLKDEMPSKTQDRHLWLRTATGLIAISMVAFSLTGLYANKQLTAMERAGLENFPHPAPWYFTAQGERARFDQMVALLTDYNQSHNPKNLDSFMVQAQDYSLRHNDKNVWRSMIMIAQSHGDNAKTAEMIATYRQLFPATAIRKK